MEGDRDAPRRPGGTALPAFDPGLVEGREGGALRGDDRAHRPRRDADAGARLSRPGGRQRAFRRPPVLGQRHVGQERVPARPRPSRGLPRPASGAPRGRRRSRRARRGARRHPAPLQGDDGLRRAEGARGRGAGLVARDRAPQPGSVRAALLRHPHVDGAGDARLQEGSQRRGDGAQPRRDLLAELQPDAHDGREAAGEAGHTRSGDAVRERQPLRVRGLPRDRQPGRVSRRDARVPEGAQAAADERARHPVRAAARPRRARADVREHEHAASVRRPRERAPGERNRAVRAVRPAQRRRRRARRRDHLTDAPDRLRRARDRARPGVRGRRREARRALVRHRSFDPLSDPQAGRRGAARPRPRLPNRQERGGVAREPGAREPRGVCGSARRALPVGPAVRPLVGGGADVPRPPRRAAARADGRVLAARPVRRAEGPRDRERVPRPDARGAGARDGRAARAGRDDRQSPRAERHADDRRRRHRERRRRPRQGPGRRDGERPLRRPGRGVDALLGGRRERRGGRRGRRDQCRDDLARQARCRRRPGDRGGALAAVGTPAGREPDRALRSRASRRARHDRARLAGRAQVGPAVHAAGGSRVRGPRPAPRDELRQPGCDRADRIRRRDRRDDVRPLEARAHPPRCARRRPCAPLRAPLEAARMEHDRPRQGDLRARRRRGRREPQAERGAAREALPRPAPAHRARALDRGGCRVLGSDRHRRRRLALRPPLPQPGSDAGGPGVRARRERACDRRGRSGGREDLAPRADDPGCALDLGRGARLASVGRARERRPDAREPLGPSPSHRACEGPYAPDRRIADPPGAGGDQPVRRGSHRGRAPLRRPRRPRSRIGLHRRRPRLPALPALGRPVGARPDGGRDRAAPRRAPPRPPEDPRRDDRAAGPGGGADGADAHRLAVAERARPRRGRDARWDRHLLGGARRAARRAHVPGAPGVPGLLRRHRGRAADRRPALHARA